MNVNVHDAVTAVIPLDGFEVRLLPPVKPRSCVWTWRWSAIVGDNNRFRSTFSSVMNYTRSDAHGKYYMYVRYNGVILYALWMGLWHPNAGFPNKQ